MAKINFQVGACYGIEVAGTTMGSFKVYNGRVIAETTNTITLKYLGTNLKVTQRKINRSDILKAVKL